MGLSKDILLVIMFSLRISIVLNLFSFVGFLNSIVTLIIATTLYLLFLKLKRNHDVLEFEQGQLDIL